MSELVATYWPAIVAALLLGIGVAWFVFAANRKAKVELDTSDILDAGKGPADRNQALIDATPAAAIEPALVSAASATPVDGDELTRIKGVGPKLVEVLAGLGVTRFDQIAAWSADDIAAINAQLGRFEGRIERDNWVEQARLLAAGDTAGFHNKFGAI